MKRLKDIKQQICENLQKSKDAKNLAEYNSIIKGLDDNKEYDIMGRIRIHERIEKLECDKTFSKILLKNIGNSIDEMYKRFEKQNEESKNNAICVIQKSIDKNEEIPMFWVNVYNEVRLRR